MTVTHDIRTYPFTAEGLLQVKGSRLGNNWPVIYLIHDDENLYIGETTSASTRMGQHLINDEKKDLKLIEIVFDETFNKSVILDYEQRLIRYCSVDNRFKKVINKNKGQKAEHDYYQRDYYRNTFTALWRALIDKGIANKSFESIENDNIFKFSPYNALTHEQDVISIDILNDILSSLENKTNGTNVSIIDGCAGTGKTVLAISIINSLVNAIHYEQTENELFIEADDARKSLTLLHIRDFIQKKRNGKPLKIGFVFPMPGIRRTIANVFKQCGNGLTTSMVIGPNDVLKDDYDILVVDESHRLSRRKNLTGYGAFDSTSRKLGLDPEKTNQLEWILKSAKHVVLFYDKLQSVKSSDIKAEVFKQTLQTHSNSIKQYKLTTQMRCEGGDDYITYVRDIMSAQAKSFKRISSYEFLLFDDVDQMVQRVRHLDSKYGLCRTVAGYSWNWVTKSNKKVKNTMERYDYLMKTEQYDILIENYKYIWNLSDENWVTRLDAPYTIGCIHTTQGFDMNYVGVILGEEIDYNFDTQEIVINLDKYCDKKVKAGMKEDELKTLIINTYITILARGIKGCYVYACNPNMKKYLENFIAKANSETLKEIEL